jgi:N-methylhydantoinase B
MNLDAVTLEVVRNQLEGIADEMGDVLIHGAYSPNIKERQDCSTALFDADGRMVAQAEHIPVHLGAMPEAVQAVLDRNPVPGEAYVLNDPFTGGTHLPDVTIVAPIAVEREIIGYGVTRAHHGDIGGMTPGSMPAGATEIYQEGLRLPVVRLVSEENIHADVMDLVLANVRNPNERRADIRAQLAANDRAIERVRELVEKHGWPTVEAAFDAVIDYSRKRIENELEEIPDGVYRANDRLEGDGVTEEEIPIEVTVTVDGTTVDVDFSGTSSQVAGNMNAPLAVAKSAVYFVVRAVTDPDIPPTEGCYQPISVRVPEGSLLNPTHPAAVVGGNVETSQRVTDVVLDAFAEAVPERVPAQSQGTMNNLIIGTRSGDGFTYYETIGGGFGGRASGDGIDGVQVGMTNTLNTPIEALEAEYPMRVERYELRDGSGGDGKHRGGLGIERSITVETDATVSLLTERRKFSPRGAHGGADGTTGANLIDGTPVPAKTTVDVDAGTTVTVKTPGGGGYGDPTERSAAERADDRLDGKTSDDDA